MTVYVDNARIPYRRGSRKLLMSHMLADDTEELESMARTLGIKPSWIQYSGTYREHYDVCASKRALALRSGAQAVDPLFLVRLRQQRRKKELEDG
ncbi:hypothetical protein LCGC14_0736470 [marine sediment metagenome]|uniref:DUF4031 domain-containing protein n=1 Tax=marine sediment metagenome TaxID=412755 RepID=A0A0F9QC87_9ZZZZ